MSTLKWDEVGERTFETGVSRGVLYKEDGFGVPWNGLTSVDNDVTDTAESAYYDGTKFADIITYGEFVATLKAFTYPDEFLEYEGIQEDSIGFFVFNQSLKRFGLSYQTVIGNDVDGVEHGYKIHLLYNLLAIPAQRTYNSLSLSVDPLEFEWAVTGIPEHIPNYRPTCHVVIDSTKIDPYLLIDLEQILYGEPLGSLDIIDHGDGSWSATTEDEGVITDFGDGSFEITTDSAEYLSATRYTISDSAHDAYLPSLTALMAFIKNWSRLVITDNEDGTWTAYSPVPGIIVMLDDTTFLINSENAVYLDSSTYTITSDDKNEGDIWLPR